MKVCFKEIDVMSLPPCHSPGPTATPATPATPATSATGSAPEPGFCIRSTIQHHDDFPARAA